MDESLQKYRDHLVQADQKSQEDFDKTLLTLSSGGLGLSLFFLKDIVGGKVIERSCYLLSGWAFLAISLGLVLLGFFLSRRALRKSIDQIDRGTIYIERPGGMWTIVVEWLNVLGGVFFLAGIGCIIWFAVGNIDSRLGGQAVSNQRQNSDDQRGNVSPPAPGTDPGSRTGAGYVPSSPPPSAPPTQQAPAVPAPPKKE
jgi:hypothetical protein